MGKIREEDNSKKSYQSKKTKSSSRRRKGTVRPLAKSAHASGKRTRSSSGTIKKRRRRARRRIVLLQRVCLTAFTVAVIGGGFALWYNLPTIKLSRQLSVGKEYEEAAAYSEAIASYERALQLDSTSVQAYRCMAGAYLNMEDEPNAKKVLFEGWENTQDESLLQYYCTVILNEAVAQINAGECSLDTVDKILSVLEQDSGNADATLLMDQAYEHLLKSLTEEAAVEFFYDRDEEAEYCSFTSYEGVMNRLFDLYRRDASEQVKHMIEVYAAPVADTLKVSRRHLEAWKQLLATAQEITGSEDRKELLACLTKEAGIQATFADLFVEFDAGNYEAAKDFIVTDTYTGIRDAFIEGSMDYWKGETSIPVSRESVTVERTEEGFCFFYPAFKDNEDTAGIITVWGNPMMDSGVRRSCISYEPAKESGSYYPHREYVISYVNSNVQKKNSFTEEMNYHFETRTWTEEGMITQLVGDWGGPYQWEKTY